MRSDRLPRTGPAAGVAMLVAAMLGAAPAGADGDIDLSQSLCPMLSESGAKAAAGASGLTNATSGITGKQAPDPALTEIVSRMALQAYCPQAFAQLGQGHLPDVPFLLNDRPPIP